MFKGYLVDLSMNCNLPVFLYSENVKHKKNHLIMTPINLFR